ncbi:MAG: type III PLP-dependent enzyme, partial [Acetobacteraceae bacterium]
MTPKITHFLDDRQPPAPCLVFDLDHLEANFRRLRRTLPLAEIFYAVKANPAPPVLERLVSLGSSFDAASFEEIAACLAV